jgi:hypothetical protein
MILSGQVGKLMYLELILFRVEQALPRAGLSDLLGMHSRTLPTGRAWFLQRKSVQTVAHLHLRLNPQQHNLLCELRPKRFGESQQLFCRPGSCNYCFFDMPSFPLCRVKVCPKQPPTKLRSVQICLFTNDEQQRPYNFD